MFALDRLLVESVHLSDLTEAVDPANRIGWIDIPSIDLSDPLDPNASTLDLDQLQLLSLVQSFYRKIDPQNGSFPSSSLLESYMLGTSAGLDQNPFGFVKKDWSGRYREGGSQSSSNNLVNGFDNVIVRLMLHVRSYGTSFQDGIVRFLSNVKGEMVELIEAREPRTNEFTQSSIELIAKLGVAKDHLAFVFGISKKGCGPHVFLCRVRTGSGKLNLTDFDITEYNGVQYVSM